MSLASQTLTESGENVTSGTVAVLLATDFALATLPCRALGHGKLCSGVANEVQNRGSSSACERRRSIASGATGTHGLHAA